MRIWSRFWANVVLTALRDPDGTLRQTDVIARTGGDELAVILPNADEARAVVVAEKLLAAVRLAATVQQPDRHAHVRTSIGIAMFVADEGLESSSSPSRSWRSVPLRSRAGSSCCDSETGTTTGNIEQARELEIDGEFISHLPDNHADRLVVAAVVDIARGLGADTIAEFVQDDRTIQLLRNLGVGSLTG
jgi:predicted signal transduction protein with EAL and GGDEF domain